MDSSFWDQRIETLPPDRLRQLQDHRLQWQVRRTWDSAPFYQAHFEHAALSPDTFGGLSDLARLPLLTAETLASLDDPASFQAAPDAWIVGSEQSAGGLSARHLTHGDRVHRADVAARAWWAAGVRAGQKVGVRGSRPPDSSAIQVEGLARIGAHPSQHGEGELPVIEWQTHTDADETTAERPAIAAALHIPFVGQTVAFSCQASSAVHWAEDHFLVEVLDSATGEPRAAGEAGELVVTDLTREANPLIRYRTGLDTMLDERPCPCGRTSRRSPFVRRLP